MATRELHVELLLGRQVRDSAGRKLGRLEEIRAEREGGIVRVTELLTGGVGAAQRIGMGNLPFAALGLLGLTMGHGYRIDWRQMDLSDPLHPRTHCRREELPSRAGPS